MYSKSLSHATCAIALLFAAACSIAWPWRNEQVGEEVNVVFSLRGNLLYLSSATIDGHAGQFLFGSSAPRTILDPRFAQTLGPDGHSLQLNARRSLRFTPVLLDLRGLGDGIVGSDIWGNSAVTIDYHAGLVTLQRSGIHPDLMTIYRYAEEPMINVVVDGRSMPAIVDTTSPDTLTLPRLGAAAGRRNARVQVAGTDFGDLEVRLADVAAPRVGNRLLSKFLVSIDYGRHQVGLWRDPRIAL
jgi:hypothetical protein